MGNKYKYIDPDFQYTNKNGVLKNLANIEDEKVLLAYESLKVSKRLEELYENHKNQKHRFFAYYSQAFISRCLCLGWGIKNSQY